MPDHHRPGSPPRRLAAWAGALLRARTRRSVGGADPPAVSLYGFEAHGRWASAMLHNRSTRPIADAAPFVVDDERALVGRREGMTLSSGSLAQITFQGGTEVSPSPSRCFVEFTDADGRPWVVGVDRVVGQGMRPTRTSPPS